MKLRAKSFCVAASILLAIVGGSAATALAADAPKRVDFSYRQFKGYADGTCVKQQPPPHVNASVGGIFIGWIAGKIVSSLSARAERELKKYLSERESGFQYEDFHDSGKWVAAQAPFDPASQLSCWELLERECPKSDTACTNTERLKIVGLYSRDQSVLKVVPISVSITGLAAKVHKDGKQATIAVSQTMSAVWLDGNRGRKETLFSEILVRDKFDYSPNAQTILDLATPKDRADAVKGSEPLPLPPNTSPTPAYVGVSFKVAEANKAPAVLKWIASFLADKHDDLSAELAAALDDL